MLSWPTTINQSRDHAWGGGDEVKEKKDELYSQAATPILFGKPARLRVKKQRPGRIDESGKHADEGECASIPIEQLLKDNSLLFRSMH
jgi:hypothetical protein